LGGPGGREGKRTLHVNLRISQRQKHRTERMNHVSMYDENECMINYEQTEQSEKKLKD